VGRTLANPWVFACIAVVFAGCASEGSPKVQAELTRLEQDSLDGLVAVERALADPTYRSLGEGVRAVESAIGKLGALENDPSASDAQRFQSMVASARAWDDLAGAFERAAASSSVQSLKDKATPARFFATSGYVRAYEYACTQGLSDHPLFVESGASCPE
jgi:hypothetical protein